MQAGYYSTAWKDIKSTPNWMGKMFLLALISFIPVFGAIVVYGYLYGWARDIAWGISRPMPQRIFGNEDGKLYSRGFFICVLGVVCAFLPSIITAIGGFISGFGVGVSSTGFTYYGGSNYGSMAVFGLIGALFSLVAFVAFFALLFFQWVGSMRISIYGRISAGFQVKKIWAMIKKDTSGILRIFGMLLLTGFIVGTIISIISSIVITILMFTALGAIGGITGGFNYYDPVSMLGYILGIGGFALLVLLVIYYLTMVLAVWIMALTANALGYWTRQFDVPAWRGQEDPMPFELQQAAQKAARASYQPPYPQTPAAPPVAPQQQPYQPPQATPQYQQPVTQPQQQPYQTPPAAPQPAPVPVSQQTPVPPVGTAPQTTPGTAPSATPAGAPQAAPADTQKGSGA